MAKLKVMTILGTRPEIIRLSAVIKACDNYFNHILVHTGQNWDYTLNEIFFKDLLIRKPDYFLNVKGDDLGQTMGNIIAASFKVLSKETPDALLILGDTNSALSTIPAKRLKIPIFHMEAGNRCFDQNVPEEINRKIVDHISDINLPYTEHSRRYLLTEGIRKEHVFVTGSPMAEVLFKNKEKIEASSILKQLKLSEKKYIVVSAHREENIDIPKKFNALMKALNEIARNYKMPIIFSTHPRTLQKIKKKRINFSKYIRIEKPFGYFDYNKLQKYSYCVLSDSGTLSEESALLSFPAVLIRTSTERPEVLDKGSIVIGGITAESITQSVELSTESFRHECDIQLPADYLEKNISIKVIKLIQSYVPIINAVIWKK